MTSKMTGDPSLTYLRPLAERFPAVDVALGEMARLAAELPLPKGTIHVISDVHGEDGKLRHVINNASGTLRPRVEQLFAGRLSAEQMQEFVTLLFYPRETLEKLEPTLVEASAQAEVLPARVLANHRVDPRVRAGYSWTHVVRTFPVVYRDLLQDMICQAAAAGDTAAFQASVKTLVDQGQAFPILCMMVQIVRDLAIDELVLAGDCWDRGPRGDRVVETLQRQPNLVFHLGQSRRGVAGRRSGARTAHRPCVCASRCAIAA